jgi:hypothetical protein
MIARVWHGVTEAASGGAITRKGAGLPQLDAVVRWT